MLLSAILCFDLARYIKYLLHSQSSVSNKHLVEMNEMRLNVFNLTIEFTTFQKNIYTS